MNSKYIGLIPRFPFFRPPGERWNIPLNGLTRGDTGKRTDRSAPIHPGLDAQFDKVSRHDTPFYTGVFDGIIGIPILYIYAGKSVGNIGNGGPCSEIVPSTQYAVSQVSRMSLGAVFVNDGIFDLSVDYRMRTNHGTRIQFCPHFDYRLIQYYHWPQDPGTGHNVNIWPDIDRTLPVIDHHILQIHCRVNDRPY